MSSTSALYRSLPVEPEVLKRITDWILKRLSAVLENLDEMHSTVLVVFVNAVADLNRRWGTLDTSINKQRFGEEAALALEDAILAVLAQRGDGSYSAMKEFKNTREQVLLMDAFSRLVALVGGMKVALEFCRRIRQHEPGFHAAVLVSAMQDNFDGGVEESFKKLRKFASVWLRKRFPNEPAQYEYEDEKDATHARVMVGVNSKQLRANSSTPTEMDLSSQVAITLHERFGGKSDRLGLIAKALDGGLDIAPRAVVDDLTDQRRHRRLADEKTPLPKTEKEIEILTDTVPHPDPQGPDLILAQYLKDHPEEEEILKVVLSDEDRETVARRHAVTPKTVTNRKNKAQKKLKHWLVSR